MVKKVVFGNEKSSLLRSSCRFLQPSRCNANSDRHDENFNNSVTPVTPVTLVTQLKTKAVAQAVSQLQPVTSFGNEPVSVNHDLLAQLVIPTPATETTAEVEALSPQSPQPPAAVAVTTSEAAAEICRGQRVRVHCFGSQRDGLAGSVRELVGSSKAVVWLDDARLRSDLR